MVEISDVRRRLLQAIDRAKQASAARRERIDAASRHYQTFLNQTAAPVFRMMANALKAEGYLFNVFTPQDRVRLVSAKSGEEFVELELDASRSVPAVIGRATFARGRSLTTIERPVKENAALENLTEEDVLQFLLTALEPFLEP